VCCVADRTTTLSWPNSTTCGTARHVTYEDEPGRRSAAKLLSKDEARRLQRTSRSCRCCRARHDAVHHIAKHCVEFARRITRCCALGQVGRSPPVPQPPGRSTLRSLSEATNYDQPRARTLAWGSFCGDDRCSPFNYCCSFTLLRDEARRIAVNFAKLPVGRKQ